MRKNEEATLVPAWMQRLAGVVGWEWKEEGEEGEGEEEKRKNFHG